MFSDTILARETARQQREMFARYVGPNDPNKISNRALAKATGIGATTLAELANGSAMTVAQMLALRSVLPPEAINMLLEAGDARLVDAETAETNWDDLAANAAGLVSDVCEARRDGKIDHVEKGRLRKRTRELIAKAQHAVEDG
ncbi:hypothetical protein [Sphingomonas montanisoli]|uniref:Uncharacterized protein n=1 Tax=Sphingomonas montanisoli TaxID=2606412 RepID=A0A5D9BZK8_9SPHN|nr:hypothetical protein [Sphingomonas montanisoli]TZG24889.1 hypothetical protein FYJ91_16545 [Sphingomonas montanisoli]